MLFYRSWFWESAGKPWLQFSHSVTAWHRVQALLLWSPNWSELRAQQLWGEGGVESKNNDLPGINQPDTEISFHSNSCFVLGFFSFKFAHAKFTATILLFWLSRCYLRLSAGILFLFACFFSLFLVSHSSENCSNHPVLKNHTAFLQKHHSL